MLPTALVLVLAVTGCATGGPLPAPLPVLAPAASIRLSGTSASSVAEANGWLWVTHFEASVLSQVDPRTNAEAGLVDIGGGAATITAIGSDLWVAHYAGRPEDTRLTRVDALRASVVGRVPLSRLCCEVAGAAGRVWAVDPTGTLVAIDPSAGVVGRTPVAVDPAVHIGLVGDDRGLWLSSDTTPLLRVDPLSGRVTVSIDVGGGIPMAMAQGLVWGASPHHVWAVDPVSNEVRVRLPLEDTIETLSLAVTEGEVWVGARRPGYVGVVLRVDLATGRATGEAAASLPARILYAFRRVWVVDWDANVLLRFDDVR